MNSLRTILRSLNVFDPRASRPVPKSKFERPEAEIYIRNILRIYGELSAMSELKPCSAVNTLFRELVGCCTKTLNEATTRAILKDQRIIEITHSLRIICATAESHLESFWADKIATAEEEVYTALSGFPYYENYVDLTRMELSALYSIEPSTPRKIAFIGSGPLPLTSLCLHMALETNSNRFVQSSSAPSPPPSPAPSPMTSSTESLVIVNIDHSKEAILQSEALCSRLGPQFRGMQFACEEAGNAELDLSDFDVVYLAALVGMTPEDKGGILVDVVRRMRVGSLLVMRTAHSLRALLYPEFDATTGAVMAWLDIQMVVHPYNHVVNSVIIGRVRARAVTPE